MIMLSWITKIKLELMAYEAMFATSPSSCGSGFLVIRSGRIVGSMWRPTVVEAINRWTPRAKGASNRAQSGLGRSAQACSSPVWPRFLPGCFSRDSLFVCTCIWAFDVVSFMVKAWILAIQASLFSGWVPEDLHVDASVLGSFGVMFIMCVDLCQASWSFHKVLIELLPKVLLLVPKSCVNNILQIPHSQVNLLHH
jgi:hypothetical protein